MKDRMFNACIGARIRRVSRILDNKYRELVSGYGISEHQLNILFYMCEAQSVEQGEIGKYLVLDRSTVSRNIKHLLDKGLLSRTADYRPTITLTSKGRELTSAIEPAWNTLMDDLEATLGKEGLNSVKALETKLKKIK